MLSVSDVLSPQEQNPQRIAAEMIVKMYFFISVVLSYSSSSRLKSIVPSLTLTAAHITCTVSPSL